MTSRHARSARLIHTLSAEVMLHVFQYLDQASLLSCALVSRRWHDLASADALWRALLRPPQHHVVARDALCCAAPGRPGESTKDRYVRAWRMNKLAHRRRSVTRPERATAVPSPVVGVVAYNSGVLTVSEDGYLRSYALPGLALRATSSGHHHHRVCVVSELRPGPVSQRPALLASADVDRQIVLWDPVAVAALCLLGSPFPVAHLLWSAVEPVLVSWSEAGCVAWCADAAAAGGYGRSLLDRPSAAAPGAPAAPMVQLGHKERVTRSVLSEAPTSGANVPMIVLDEVAWQGDGPRGIPRDACGNSIWGASAEPIGAFCLHRAAPRPSEPLRAVAITQLGVLVIATDTSVSGYRVALGRRQAGSSQSQAQSLPLLWQRSTLSDDEAASGEAGRQTIVIDVMLNCVIRASSRHAGFRALCFSAEHPEPGDWFDLTSAPEIGALDQYLTHVHRYLVCAGPARPADATLPLMWCVGADDVQVSPTAPPEPGVKYQGLWVSRTLVGDGYMPIVPVAVAGGAAVVDGMGNIQTWIFDQGRRREDRQHCVVNVFSLPNERVTRACHLAVDAPFLVAAMTHEHLLGVRQSQLLAWDYSRPEDEILSTSLPVRMLLSCFNACLPPR